MQPTRRRRPGHAGAEGLGKATQAGTHTCDAPHDMHQVGHRSGQAVELRHDQDVARSQAHEQGVQLRLPVIVLPCGPLLDKLLASGIGQRAALCAGFGVVPAAGREVADQHGIIPPWPTGGQGRVPHPSGTPVGASLTLGTSMNRTKSRPCKAYRKTHARTT